MRGTEGYTGRYVWKLSVLFNLGRKRRGAAAPCIHWEDPVLNMASGVCKAYIRGALATDWFWNKFSHALWASQAKVVPAVNGSLYLTSTRSFRIHLESSWSLTTRGRSVLSVRAWPDAPAFPRAKCLTTQAESPRCLQTCFGRRLSIHLYRKPLSKSLHCFLIHVSDRSCGSVWHRMRVYLKWMVLVHFCF